MTLLCGLLQWITLHGCTIGFHNVRVVLHQWSSLVVARPIIVIYYGLMCGVALFLCWIRSFRTIASSLSGRNELVWVSSLVSRVNTLRLLPWYAISILTTSVPSIMLSLMTISKLSFMMGILLRNWIGFALGYLLIVVRCMQKKNLMMMVCWSTSLPR